MKYFVVLLLCALVFVGCKSAYNVTLNNGTKFTGVSKPVFNKQTGKYHFKTPDGREGAVHPERIRLIEPQEESSSSQFKTTPKK